MLPRIVVVLLLIACRPESLAAQVSELEFPERVMRRQVLAEQEPWRWDRAEATLAHALQRYDGKYSFTLKSTPKAGAGLELTIGGNDLQGWTGTCHWQTPFVIEGDELFVVEFHPSSPFGRVLCIDLREGREKWKCAIGEVVPVWFASAYASQRIIAKRQGLIYVWGSESMGHFVNIIDANTGELVAERLYTDQPAAK